MAPSLATGQARARRAARAPFSKSMSVDEGVMAASSSTISSSATGTFGRPSSMLARTASSSAAVLNPAHATGAAAGSVQASANVGLAQRMKSASISSKLGVETKSGAALQAVPRRVLGDVSNAAKMDQRGTSGKDGLKGDPVKPSLAANRVRSGSTLSSKPLAPRSTAGVSSNANLPSTASGNTITNHARSTSAASRHSVLSHKSSQSSIHHASSNNATSGARVRAGSADLQAPGAPRICSGAFAPHPHSRTASSASANLHLTAPIAGVDVVEEILDTVEEGDSYIDGPARNKHGLGITIAGPSSENCTQDLEMEDRDDSAEMSHDGESHLVHIPSNRHSGSSNDTFELDLDNSIQDDGNVQGQGVRLHLINGGKDTDMDIDGRTAKKLKTDFSQGHVRGHAHRHSSTQQRDPSNWLALRDTIQRDADRKLAQVQRDFKEELDLWDPSMVAEYQDEIFQYMEELELESMPNPDYMDAQTEIEWPMRSTLIDWLLQVHMRYHMLPETLWITINLIDRFLSNRVVSLVKLQLVGVTAMFVAAKYEEIMAPSVDEFVYMTESNYTRDEILKGERIILQSLDFKISTYCSPYSWIRRISKADDYDIQTRTLSKFLMEVTLLDHRFLRAKPSMIAAIAMFLARRMLGSDWSEAFIFYSKYTEEELATPTSYLLAAIAADGFEDRFVYQKYSGKKFLKAAIFARSWAKSTLVAIQAQEASMT